MHVIGDLAVAIAYFSIPITLLYLLYKRKKGVPFKWVIGLFAVFILLCGTTHVVEMIGLWRPYYYLEGVLKILTAVASLITAILVFPLVHVVIEKLDEVENEARLKAAEIPKMPRKSSGAKAKPKSKKAQKAK